MAAKEDFATNQKWVIDPESDKNLTERVKQWNDMVKQWNDKLQQQSKDEMAKKIFESLAVIKPNEEPEIDYEPITVDRRTDTDYIEKLSGDNKLFVMVLAELVSQGKADFLFIEYPEIQEIWHRHCNNLGKLRAKEAEQKRIKELKESALKKLTPDEKKALGLK